MMRIYPESYYADIEFDQILDLTADMTRGSRARQHIAASFPYQDFQLWKTDLQMVQDLTQWKRDGISYKPGNYQDIRHALDRVKIQAYSLDLQGVLDIKQVLDEVFTLDKWTVQKELNETNLRTLYVGRIHADVFRLKTELDQVFYPDGQVREDASPELSRLHKQLSSQERNINSAFQQVVQKYKARNLLTDPYESYKNGRQVLCVAVENKRAIPGMIQDESSSGRTIYIEPQEMTPMYQVIAEIRSDIRQEINRLIQRMSANIRELRFEIREAFLVLTAYDVWNAKSELALQVDGKLPGLRPKPHLEWKEAYHTVLKIHHEKAGKKVVPFDLTLDPGQRLIVVSGPNAGGKSVLLKAVALNQLMLQCGYLIPVSDESVAGMFRRFFADIGDQQSLEEDLSTYSSHLRNMREFLRHADHHSMVFMDELGSGTDPQYGGAISEAILKSLADRSVWGVVTTHYFNLKMFADQHPGIQNGAMSFDKKNLEPTYHFIPGKPGSSFAFEIARKSGLPRRIIAYARNKAGRNKWAIEEMLVNLENEKAELQKKEKELERMKVQVNQLMNSNKALADELSFQRKKWKKNVKMKQLNQQESERKWLQQRIRELDQAESVQQARALEQEMRREQEELTEEIEELDHTLERIEKIPDNFFNSLQEGDYVRYKDGNITGRIRSIQKNKVELEVGGIRMKVRKKDLRPGKEPLTIRKGKAIATDLQKKNIEIPNRIDIRGYSASEAEKELEQFLDEATMANMGELRILHGKGSGVLRKLVRDKLREYHHVQEVSHPPREQGGDGVTVVKL